MADNRTGPSEVSAVAATIISSIVQAELIQASILLPTVDDYSAFAQPGSKTVSIPRFGSFVAESKLTLVDMSSQALTAATDDISLSSHVGVVAELEDAAQIESSVDVMSEYLQRMARAIAYKLDQDLYAQIKLTSSASPDHRIAYASGSTVTVGDFTAAKKLLRIQNVPVDSGNLYLCVSPKAEAEMLGLANFVDASYWASGSEAIKLNGQIGKAYGFQIFVSNVVTDDRSVFYHKSHCGFARQMAPRFEQGRNLKAFMDLLGIQQKYGVKVMDSGKRGVEVGSSS